MLHGAIILVLGVTGSQGAHTIRSLFDDYRHRRFPENVRLLGVGLYILAHPDFIGVITSAVGDEQNLHLVDEFKLRWCYWSGDILQEEDSSRLGGLLVGYEDGYRRYGIFRKCYVCLPSPIADKIFTKRLLPPYLRVTHRTAGPDGLARLNFHASSYPDLAFALKKRFPEFSSDGDSLSFHIPPYETRPKPGKCPIARAPNEVLLIVFTMLAEMEGTSPAILRCCCKHWYRLVDNTPSLWSFLSSYHYPYSAARLEYFLTKSAQTGLHVGLLWCELCENQENGLFEDSDCRSHDVNPVLRHIDRIVCLKLPCSWMEYLLPRTFPSLRRLFLYKAYERHQRAGLIILDMSKMPLLTTLDIYRASDDPGSPYEPMQIPELQLSPSSINAILILRLMADEHGNWTDIIHACRASLKSLVLGFFHPSVVATHSRISLHSLECLAIEYGTQPIDASVHFESPRLMRYAFKCAQESIPTSITFDQSAVVQLRTSQATLPLAWPRVCVLQIEYSSTLVDYLDLLLDSYPVFPSLDRVEVLEDGSGDGHRRSAIASTVQELHRRMNKDILLVTDSQWAHQIAGYDNDVLCGKDMPCKDIE